jgi:hypothetical protein
LSILKPYRKPQRPLNTPTVDEPTATMKAAYEICKFAYGRNECRCSNQRRKPCDAILIPAKSIIAVAKEELAEKFVLRKKPTK